MHPLKIEFRLQTAVKVPEYPINLDGLLAYACVREYVDSNQMTLEEAHNALPLEKEDGVWKSSNVIFKPGQRAIKHINRVFNVYETIEHNGVRYKALRRNKWDSEGSSTVNKAYLFAEPMRLFPSAHAYCIGDKEKIEYLLNKHITHIGKYSRIDAGRISSITVSVDDDARKMWEYRTLPILRDNDFNYAKTLETLSPPYWDKTKRVECYTPI